MPTFNCSLKRWGPIGGLLSLVALLFLFGPPPASQATAQQEPDAPLAFSSGGTINFQGQLTTLAGAVLNGSYNLRFAIYDAPSAGSKRWPRAPTKSIPPCR